MRFLIFVMIGSIVLSSCFDRGDCLDVSSNVLAVNFYKYSTKKDFKIKMDSVVTGSNLVLYKLEKDSLSGVKLPLSYGENLAVFHFYYQGHEAILNIDYSHRVFALAPDCSAADYLSLQDASAVVIKDLKISSRDLTKNATENIKLYF